MLKKSIVAASFAMFVFARFAGAQEVPALPVNDIELDSGIRLNYVIQDGAFAALSKGNKHIPDKGEHLVRYCGWSVPSESIHQGRQDECSCRTSG